jgi:hypothetical protein
MGPFQWLTTHWTPVIEYRDYAAIEVEDIAWGSTLIGSRRGFLLGFPAGALFIMLILGGVALTRLYNPSAPTTAPSQGQQEATASRALSAELSTLREENQTLKQQVRGRQEATASRALSAELSTLREENQTLKQQVRVAKAAATCPPCQPQALGKAQPQAKTLAAPPQPSKQATTRPAERPFAKKSSATLPDDQVAQPIPSNCRREGDCQ